MPPIDHRASFVENLWRWGKTVALKAPRESPDVLVYVSMAAVALLLIYAFATLEGFLS